MLHAKRLTALVLDSLLDDVRPFVAQHLPSLDVPFSVRQQMLELLLRRSFFHAQHSCGLDDTMWHTLSAGYDDDDSDDDDLEEFNGNFPGYAYRRQQYANMVDLRCALRCFYTYGCDLQTGHYRDAALRTFQAQFTNMLRHA